MMFHDSWNHSHFFAAPYDPFSRQYRPPSALPASS